MLWCGPGVARVPSRAAVSLLSVCSQLWSSCSSEQLGVAEQLLAVVSHSSFTTPTTAALGLDNPCTSDEVKGYTT